MARIRSYAQDTNITDQDRILGSSYEGMLNNKPIYQTKNYKITDLAGYFSKNFNFEGVNFDLIEIKNTVETTFDVVQNLGNSLGSLNEDGSLASISVDFANDLVGIVSTVPDLFTELALSNLSAVPKAFADFLFTVADANEAFANQVLDLATSAAYATADQFNAFEQLVINNTDDIDAITGNITSLTTTVNTNTGDINANALQLDIIATRVTTAETNVVALQTDVVELNTDVNTLTGDIATQATQLSLIGNRVTTSEASITNLQSDFTDLSTTVDGNTGNIATNATQISSLNTVVLTANTNIAALQTDVTILETSIDNISGEVAANASDISLLTTNVNTEIDGLRVDVTALDTEITTLTTTVNNNTGDIATQATQVSLLANRVDTAEADILNTKTDVTSLTTTVDGNTGNIATNASNISILQTNVDTQQAQITGIITNIQQIETSVDNVTGEVEANATAIEGLATRVTTAEAEVVNVAGDITTLNTNLNTQTGRIDTNVQNISTLSTTVNNNFTTLNASITTVNNARISGDSANATYSFNVASSIGSVDASGNITAVSEAFANSIISTETTNTYATAIQLDSLSARVGATEDDVTAVESNIDDIEIVVASKPNVYRQTTAPTGSIPIKSVWYDTDDNNKPYVYESGGWVEVRDGKVTELETYALAQKTLEADANGIITGITIKSENSGDAATPISDITFKTSTFNIVDQSNNPKLALDSSGNLTINGGGTFTGTLQAGDVTVSNNLINVESNAGILTFTENGVNRGAIIGADSSLNVQSDNQVSIFHPPSTNGVFVKASGVSASSNNSFLVSAAGIVQLDAGTINFKLNPLNGQATLVDAEYILFGATDSDGTTLMSIDGEKVNITGQLTVNGSSVLTPGNISNSTITISASGPLGGGGDFTLNQTTGETITITHDASPQGNTAYSGGTVIQNFLTDGYGHITDVTAVNLDGRYLTSLPSHNHNDLYYTETEINNLLSTYVTETELSSSLSSYALASSVPTDTSQLTNGAGYITSSALSGYATEAYVNSAVPTSSQVTQWNAAYNFSVFGGTVSGNIYADDFILNSDASLKENVVDYVPKPINIAYKEYSFIGTQDKRVGVIAQELEVDHPEFIRESGIGKKSVSYIDLLLAKVAELEARIKQLENGSGS